MSVARECNMVKVHDNLILVQALPPQGSVTSASIEFMYADDNKQDVNESVKTPSGVPFFLFYFIFFLNTFIDISIFLKYILHLVYRTSEYFVMQKTKIILMY